MKRFRLVLVALMALLVFESSSSVAVACWLCKYSPNGWGFCDTGAMRGHGDCTDKVVDSFSGRRGCEIIQWATCGRGLAEGGCPADEPDCFINYQASLPCTWTEMPAAALT